MRIKKISSPGRVLVAVLALLTPAALYAASSSADAIVPSTTWVVQVGNQANHKAIQGEQFLPGDITINQGDSVTWKARSAEPHTVTFVDGGQPQTQADLGEFNPGDPSQTTRSSSHDFDGVSTYESGVLTTQSSFSALPPIVTLYHRYTLHFNGTAVGTYTYYCRVHGVMMRGEIHVQPLGSAYPATQADYDAQSSLVASAIVADGRAELEQAKAMARSHKVIVGADDHVAMLMRFVQTKVVVHKGDTVRFANALNGVPHTVTFGDPMTTGDPTAAYGHPGRYRGGQLSSGVIAPQSTFKVTFKKAGRFPYRCFFHQDLGMTGVVVVKP